MADTVRKAKPGHVVRLLDGRATDIAIGADGMVAQVSGRFSVQVYSPTNAFDGATVNIYTRTVEGGWILDSAYTGADSLPGQTGDHPLYIKAEVTGSGGAADINVDVYA